MEKTTIGTGKDGLRSWNLLLLLTSVTRHVAREQCSDTISSPSCPERISRDDEISPTIQWMAEDNHKTDDLTIVSEVGFFQCGVRSDDV